MQKYSLNVNDSPSCIILTVGVDRSGGKSIGSKIDTYIRFNILIAKSMKTRTNLIQKLVWNLFGAPSSGKQYSKKPPLARIFMYCSWILQPISWYLDKSCRWVENWALRLWEPQDFVIILMVPDQERQPMIDQLGFQKSSCYYRVRLAQLSV